MNDYVIFTDSSCDVAPELLGEWGVKYASLTFQFEGSAEEYDCSGMPLSEFYERMRQGGVAKTSAVNIDTFLNLFEPELAAGRDLLYVGFSSGLSNTSNAAILAAEQLRERYPERTIHAIDTLSASAGQGLALYLAVQAKKDGASVDEAAELVREKIFHLCHWFTVADLVYLKRGGRISATTALAGTVLGIKPVLHMDDEGHLINMFKVRGRRRAIQALAEKYRELAEDPKGVYFISHGDCLEDAQLLEEMISKVAGHKAGLITYVSPVIGAHSGPGTLALFFLGRER